MQTTTITHANKLSLESPPEAAIEATPETTPFVTPVKVSPLIFWLRTSTAVLYNYESSFSDIAQKFTINVMFDNFRFKTVFLASLFIIPCILQVT